MSTQENQVPKNYSAKDNGQGDPQQGGSQEEYYPDDYSQKGINRGQRKINYAHTVVDVKLAKALETLKDAIAGCCEEIDLVAVEAAISDVYKTSERVADIIPPGCDTTWN